VVTNNFFDDTALGIVMSDPRRARRARTRAVLARLPGQIIARGQADPLLEG